MLRLNPMNPYLEAVKKISEMERRIARLKNVKGAQKSALPIQTFEEFLDENSFSFGKQRELKIKSKNSANLLKLKETSKTLRF
jgi:hypothetical protein